MKETNNKYISDDEVTILGGSEWKPGRKSGKKKVNRWMILSICLAGALTGVAIFFSIRHFAHITEFVFLNNVIKLTSRTFDVFSCFTHNYSI